MMPQGRPRWELDGDAAIVAAFLAAVLLAARGLSVDYRDGILGIEAALGALGRGFPIEATRPPLDWFALLPAGLLWRSQGPIVALGVAHGLMCAFAAAAVWRAGTFARRLLGPRAALFAVALTALNPLLLHYAPFSLFDAFSAVWAADFAVLSWRYLRAPTRRALAMTLISYVVAVLFSYQAALLIFAPLLYPIVEAGSPLKRLGDFVRHWPLWLAGPLAYALCVAIAAATPIFLGKHPLSWGEARAVLWAHPLAGRLAAGGSAWTYGESLLRQLGWPALALAAWGCVVLLRRAGQARYAALCLLAPLAAFCLGVGDKDGRYLLMLLPFLSTAAGLGFEVVVAKFAPKRRWAAAGALAAVCLAALARPAVLDWRGLASSESLRSDLPIHLTRAIAQLPRGRCAVWSGSVGLPDAGANPRAVLIDPVVLRFYDWPKRPDLAVRLPCDAGLMIEPSAPTPARDGAAVEYGRVYEFASKPKRRRRLLWTIQAGGLATGRSGGWTPLPR